ncbi:hypothetical protein CWI37_1097p0010 [Hamiltosporidium tvaerminnensis]|uniref:GPI ethanolamine phosphate transferase 3 n=1 Tax=Hamiltosporidium tvaerminnensis TaxID=1176355 RepID=A0A4Q9KYR1_9MICR|nr:hypothetical protein CWI37_1097p0010 [Hamiltosporidium tvaerminnensis]
MIHKYQISILNILSIYFFLSGLFKMVTPPNLFSSGELTQKKYEKTIFIILDALRIDAVLPTTNLSPYHNKLNFLNSIKNKYVAMSISGLPTSTSVRIESIATGIPSNFLKGTNTFIHAQSNHDSLIYQLINSNRTHAFFGDSTWKDIFPNINDVHILPPYNHSPDFTPEKKVIDSFLNSINNFDFIIGHFVFLDHYGHLFGIKGAQIPSSEEYKWFSNSSQQNDTNTNPSQNKDNNESTSNSPDNNYITSILLEYDTLIKNVYNKMTNDTLLVILSDHGVNEDGSHGSSTPQELASVAIFINKNEEPIDLREVIDNTNEKIFANKSKSNSDNKSENIKSDDFKSNNINSDNKTENINSDNIKSNNTDNTTNNIFKELIDLRQENLKKLYPFGTEWIGYTGDKLINIIHQSDILPTVCTLSGLPVPYHSYGSLICELVGCKKNVYENIVRQKINVYNSLKGVNDKSKAESIKGVNDKSKVRSIKGVNDNSIEEGVNKLTEKQKGVSNSTNKQHPLNNTPYKQHPFNNSTLYDLDIQGVNILNYILTDILYNYYAGISYIKISISFILITLSIILQLLRGVNNYLNTKGVLLLITIIMVSHSVHSFIHEDIFYGFLFLIFNFCYKNILVFYIYLRIGKYPQHSDDRIWIFRLRKWEKINFESIFYIFLFFIVNEYCKSKESKESKKSKKSKEICQCVTFYKKITNNNITGDSLSNCYNKGCYLHKNGIRNKTLNKVFDIEYVNTHKEYYKGGVSTFNKEYDKGGVSTLKPDTSKQDINTPNLNTRKDYFKTLNDEFDKYNTKTYNLNSCNDSFNTHNLSTSKQLTNTLYYMVCGLKGVLSNIDLILAIIRGVGVKCIEDKTFRISYYITGGVSTLPGMIFKPLDYIFMRYIITNAYISYDPFTFYVLMGMAIYFNGMNYSLTSVNYNVVYLFSDEVEWIFAVIIFIVYFFYSKYLVYKKYLLRYRDRLEGGVNDKSEVVWGVRDKDMLEGVSEESHKQQGVSKEYDKQQGVNNEYNKQQDVNKEYDKQQGVSKITNEQHPFSNSTNKQHPFSTSTNNFFSNTEDIYNTSYYKKNNNNLHWLDSYMLISTFSLLVVMIVTYWVYGTMIFYFFFAGRCFIFCFYFLIENVLYSILV